MDDERFSCEVTLSRELAERLVEHYDGHDGVRSVPDALRQSARDVLDE